MACGTQDDRNRADAVTAWYVWSGSIRERALVLCIHVDTLHDRIRAARYRLDDLDMLRRCRAMRPPVLVAVA